MAFIVVGLGNPGEEYKDTRHNTGRLVMEEVRRIFEGEEFEYNKKINSLSTVVKIKKEKVTLLAPETYMNKSGSAVAGLVKNVKAAQKLIVIHDDFQIPLGRMRISYNRSSGGHNGVESIIKSLKTQGFIRIRIGLSAADSKGAAKIPHGEEKIEKFILGTFKDDELKEIKKLSKKVAEALETIIDEGVNKGMTLFNAQ